MMRTTMMRTTMIVPPAKPRDNGSQEEGIHLNETADQGLYILLTAMAMISMDFRHHVSKPSRRVAVGSAALEELVGNTQIGDDYVLAMNKYVFQFYVFMLYILFVKYFQGLQQDSRTIASRSACVLEWDPGKCSVQACTRRGERVRGGLHYCILD